MNTTIVNVKIDVATKKEAQKVAEELGLSLGSLVRGYLKHLIKTKRVEFDLSEEPSEYLIQAIKEAEVDWEKGNVSPEFDNAKDALAWLKKQGI